MEEMHRASYGEKIRSFHAPSEGTTLPQSPRVHQPGSSQNSDLLGFYGGFITQAQLIKSLATDK